MIIGINLLYLIPGRVGGTEYYARSFINELRRLDKKNNYIIFCGSETARTLHISEKNWLVFPCPTPTRFRPIRIMFEQFVFPFILMHEKIDVLHSMGYFGPVICPCQHIVTVHDANWRDHPEDTNWLENFVAKALIEVNLRTATTIVTDSKFSAERLLRHFPFLEAKLKIIMPGVDKRFFSMLKTAKADIFSFPYFLTISKYHPHKRLACLIPLWGELTIRYPGHHLVVVGTGGKQEKFLRPAFNRMARVHTMSRVPLWKMVALYAGAQAVIHPSAYEGFGFPVYEGITAGRQVFVSNKEMYDSILFDPNRLRRQYSLAAKQLLGLYFSP